MHKMSGKGRERKGNYMRRKEGGSFLLSPVLRIQEEMGMEGKGKSVQIRIPFNFPSPEKKRGERYCEERGNAPDHENKEGGGWPQGQSYVPAGKMHNGGPRGGGGPVHGRGKVPWLHRQRKTNVAAYGRVLAAMKEVILEGEVRIHKEKNRPASLRKKAHTSS